MKKIRSFLPIVLSAMLLLGGFASCVEDEDPMAIITVVKMDAYGQEWPVSNAEVRFVLAEGTSLLQLIEFAEKPKLTDISGQVTYTVQHEGIVKIQATHGTGEESCGQGVVVFADNEVYEEKIRLSACYE